MDVFADSPLLLIFLVSVAALSAASEIGHRLGLRVAGEANVLTLEAAMLGLLALMLSFTFAMAVTRFDARRDAVLKEANAIGTVALRARLLPPPHDAESLRLLRDYVQIRLDVGSAMRDTRAGSKSGAGSCRRLPVYAMNLLAASVILLIQDIDRPTSGFISVSQQPMVDTANAVAGYWMEFENAAPRP